MLTSDFWRAWAISSCPRMLRACGLHRDVVFLPGVGAEAAVVWTPA